jgi:uncharacterized protein YvpB
MNKKFYIRMLVSAFIMGTAVFPNISYAATNMPQTTSPTRTTPASSTQPVTKVLLKAPMILQNPELPRGCEVTSLAMLLQYKGVNVDKMTLANKIQKVPYQQNGYMGNPNVGFVGNMFTTSQNGYGVYHGPIFHLAQQYLPSAVDLTGQSFTSVIDKLNQNKPVWVITNDTYAPLANSSFKTWKTTSGYVKITWYEHSVLVTGYDQSYIYFNDPLTNMQNKKANKSNFIVAWQQMGNQAISY